MANKCPKYLKYYSELKKLTPQKGVCVILYSSSSLIYSLEQHQQARVGRCTLLSKSADPTAATKPTESQGRLEKGQRVAVTG